MSEQQQTLALVEAKKRGVLAAQAAADAADRRDPAWSEKAYNAFCIFATLQGTRQFTTEDVRNTMVSVPPPPDARAWGAIAIRAKREGKVKSVGYRCVASSNNSPKVLWEYVPQS